MKHILLIATGGTIACEDAGAKWPPAFGSIMTSTTASC